MEARDQARWLRRYEAENRPARPDLVALLSRTEGANRSNTPEIDRQGQSASELQSPLPFSGESTESEGIGPPARAKVNACGEDGVVLRCGCEVRALPSFCGRRDCAAGGGPVECKDKTEKRRAAAVLDRFPMDAGPIGYAVFTVPPHMREKLADPDLFARARRAAFKLLRELGAAAYAFEATHPVGDPLPCLACGSKSVRWDWGLSPLRAVCLVCGALGREAEFHPHLNFLWTRADGRKPWIDEWTLRNEWRAVLEELTGIGAGPKGVVLHLSWGEGRGKRRHLSRYVSRLFPGFHAWLGNGRWYGGKAVPKVAPKDACCEKCRCVITCSRPMPKWRAEQEAGKRLPFPKGWGDVAELVLQTMGDFDVEADESPPDG